MNNVDTDTEPFLSCCGDYEYYSRLLALLSKIKNTLALGFAKRAASSDDAEIKELGEEWVEDLQA